MRMLARVLADVGSMLVQDEQNPLAGILLAHQL